ncbi:arylformamidase [Priestia megaterium]|uniref:arylformamidase n=1 Tax=Priestia megaterium TaxID=1404 RepID=UPI0035B6A6BC
MSKWIDISQPLDEKTAGWPGDTSFSYEVNWSKEETGSVNVGKITMSIHTGTHIDAPFHFDDNGKKVIDLDLDLYIGRTKVVHIPANKSIGTNELSDVTLKGITRLLIRTDAWQDRSVFPQTIPYIEPSLAPYLAKLGIRLLGIDLPSVDPLDSKELAAHHELAYHKIHILEGVLLDKIPSGDYELIAAPLPLVEADGSPVRALLKKIN